MLFILILPGTGASASWTCLDTRSPAHTVIKTALEVCHLQLPAAVTTLGTDLNTPASMKKIKDPVK